MNVKHILPCFLALFAIVALCPGCSSGPSEEELKQAQLQEQLVAIQEAHKVLNAGRAELEAAIASVATLEETPESKLSEEQKTELEGFKARITELETNNPSNYEDLQTKLQEFLNFSLNEAPQAAETGEGLAVYSTEAILGVKEIVAQSGNYQKAIEQLEGVKSYYELIGMTPNQPLLDQIAFLDDMRYMTKERFDLIKKNMSQDEVKEIAGVPYHRNIREDPNTGVVFWVYPKREGGAAAVYFNKKDKVYQMRFDAIKMKVVD